MRFAPDGAFELQGVGYPTFKGTWKRDGGEIEIVAPMVAGGCPEPARYRVRQEGQWTILEAVIKENPDLYSKLKYKSASA